MAAIRRHSTLTLASLIPTGLIGIAGATTGAGSTALLSAHSTDLNAQPDTAPIDTAESTDITGTPAAASTTSTAPQAPATAGGDGYFAAAAVAPVPAAAPVPVVAQTVPGAAGGPTLRNLPDLPTSLKSSPLGIPTINLATYVRAERITAERLPGCNMTWELLAGIGRVESSHANDGKVDSDGNLLDPIYGLRLDGSLPGSKVIRDTDGGEYDGDTEYDRAVGPMQFIPQTWKKYATDGTGDGKADPQNLFDAAATTAAYLCDGGLDMRDPAQATRAIMRYNNSRAYATNVSAWSAAYATGVAPRAEDLPKIH
ncbi:lytic transglycosylase domain-containing protein [Millisia brevis]|uniref:lytic transglycosylase domain-containing protein n=1 Tax=Millisia brevis TaxID=264148 RepID=UPI003F6E7954